MAKRKSATASSGQVPDADKKKARTFTTQQIVQKKNYDNFKGFDRIAVDVRKGILGFCFQRLPMGGPIVVDVVLVMLVLSLQGLSFFFLSW